MGDRPSRRRGPHARGPGALAGGRGPQAATVVSSELPSFEGNWRSIGCTPPRRKKEYGLRPRSGAPMPPDPGLDRSLEHGEAMGQAQKREAGTRILEIL